MRGRRSLARQFLGWQLAIVFALLGLVLVFSAMQARVSFRDTEGRRMLSVAEDVAATPGVRAGLADSSRHETLAPFAIDAASLSGADYVVITDPRMRVLTSPEPDQIGERLPLGASTARDGRAWVGRSDWSGRASVVAHVPVIGDDGSIVGVVAAARERPTLIDGISRSPVDALVLMGIATVLGVAGSLLLSRRVKRQTLGLEPEEITGLVEHREAMLHGIKEGVVGMDDQHRITVVNDQARDLLGLEEQPFGRTPDELGLDARLADVLTGRARGADQIVFGAGTVLVLNRMPIPLRTGRDGAGAVVTLRDRTELVTLRSELDANRNATDTLRAQAHEFTNRLHTIAGLIELGEYEEVRGYIERVTAARAEWYSEVSARVRDTAVAALLIAKSSVASEHGVGLRLDAGSGLAAVDEQLSADVVTVLGNLVDNSIDALVAHGREGWIEVHIGQGSDAVRLTVRDSGPGIAPGIAEEIFRHGFTTKAAQQGGRRGIGLALTKRICLRRNGTVEVANDGGAVFTATLPLRQEVPG